MRPGITHVGYGDESSYNAGRWRSIGLVTMPVCEAPAFSATVATILDEASIKESKWNRIKTLKRRQAAERMLDELLPRLASGRARVDVLVWDITDSRHSVKGRDDTRNLAVMYHHLCRTAMARRWPDGSTWGLYPDEHDAIEWSRLESTLTLIGRRSTSAGWPGPAMNAFQIAELRPMRSEEEPLVQIADLLAGIAVYSWSQYPVYAEWLRREGPQQTLFVDAGPALDLSNGDRARCPLLRRIDDFCKTHRWQVSLATTHGLRTRNPARSPFNFWLWEPQHPADKAPIRPSYGGN